MDAEAIEAPGTDSAEPAQPNLELAQGQPSFADLLWTVAILFCFAGGIGATYALISVILSPDLVRDAHTIPPFLMSILSVPLTVWLCWFFLCGKYRRSLREGLPAEPLDYKATLKWGAVGMLLAFAASLVVGLLYQWTETKYGNSPLAKSLQVPASKIQWTIFLLIAPITEELFFRGLVFQVFKNRMGSGWAIAVAILWFIGGHAFQLAGDWPALAAISLLGITVTLQRHVTGSILPSMITHWTYNVTVLALVMASRAS